MSTSTPRTCGSNLLWLGDGLTVSPKCSPTEVWWFTFKSLEKLIRSVGWGRFLPSAEINAGVRRKLALLRK